MDPRVREDDVSKGVIDAKIPYFSYRASYTIIPIRLPGVIYPLYLK